MRLICAAYQVHMRRIVCAIRCPALKFALKLWHGPDSRQISTLMNYTIPGIEPYSDVIAICHTLTVISQPQVMPLSACRMSPNLPYLTVPYDVHRYKCMRFCEQ